MIKKCDNDDKIKGDGFSFTRLEANESLVQSCTIDVIGVILEVGSTTTLNLKDGTTRDLRTMTIGDESKLISE